LKYDALEKIAFSGLNMLFFGRRNPLPINRVFLKNGMVASRLHHAFSLFDQAEHGGGNQFTGILVLIIFIAAPHIGQMIFARSLNCLSILKGFMCRTNCSNLISFLLPGWMKP
jgi:hypothetical protein